MSLMSLMSLMSFSRVFFPAVLTMKDFVRGEWIRHYPPVLDHLLPSPDESGGCAQLQPQIY